MINKPSIPKGTRDFSPLTMRKRNYVFEILKKKFELFGFVQIETPSFENLNTLIGKYGDEGDKLIFKILSSGDFLSKVKLNPSTTSKSIISDISNKALRYDLTIPFARYISQHRNDIIFPFRRFQMQNVWRADKPQKGRFREFYQCDADIVGTNSLLAEIELIQLYDEVFSTLGFKNISININNRKILSGIAQIVGVGDKINDFLVSLDKLEKIGISNFKDDLRKKGFASEAINKINLLLDLKTSNSIILTRLNDLFKDSEIGLEGIEELKQIVSKIDGLQLKCASLEIDITLARGLDYYTGSIFEVKTNDFNIGSIGGGGRYDNLTGIFGFENISGVGISFGFDRICMALESLNLYPELSAKTCQVLIVNFGEFEENYCLNLLKKLRAEGISSLMYPGSAKLKKQMQYADKNHIEFVIIVGQNEIKTNTITVKKMSDGSQQNMSFEKLLKFLK